MSPPVETVPDPRPRIFEVLSAYATGESELSRQAKREILGDDVALSATVGSLFTLASEMIAALAEQQGITPVKLIQGMAASLPEWKGDLGD